MTRRPAAPLLRAAIAGLVLAGSPLPAPTAGAAPAEARRELLLDEGRAVEYSQRAIGRAVGDHRFIDERGRPLRLAELRGRPVVLSLVYTACTSACPLVIQSLHRAIDAANEALGADRFAVVTVGFDPRFDTPERMRSYARSRGADLPNWRFLSGDSATIDALADEIGFLFAPGPLGFDHASQVTILDADGVVRQQVYGIDFAAPAVVEPLKALILGTRPRLSAAGMLDRVRFLCTIYDARVDRYRFSFGIFIGLGVGALCLGGVAVFLVRAWLFDGRRTPGARTT